MRLASTVIEAARAQSAPRLHLLVDRDNGRARALYEKLGFAPLRETLERLEATLGVERLVMAKDLRPPAPQTPAALR
jgi:ribosomal protein S18 acetylase RimI-like enzyme